MLSKQTKARIKRNKVKRATPKKRRLALIERTVAIATLKMKRYWGNCEKSPLYVKPKSDAPIDRAMAAIAYENALDANRKEEGRLWVQHASEDREYFNGWRRGYK